MQIDDRMSGLVIEDGRARCAWCAGHADYRAYHDREWGRPVRDDRRLFEKICLEGFQCGLSWLTILRKREAFRRAFEGFDFHRIASWPDSRLEALAADPGIVRHRGKIAAVRTNARATLAVIEEFGSLSALVWSFEPGAQERPRRITADTIVTRNSTSEALALELRRWGFRFFGPTTAYAFLQSVGVVNDHLQGCWVREEVESQRRRTGR